MNGPSQDTAGPSSGRGQSMTSSNGGYVLPSDFSDRSADNMSTGSSGNANASGSTKQAESEVTRPKVDVSHYPHYGLKRGMACTFCRRRKLRCSGDRPMCTNCVKYTKQCEYNPPVKEPKVPKADGKAVPTQAPAPGQPPPPPMISPSMMYAAQAPMPQPPQFDYMSAHGSYTDSTNYASLPPDPMAAYQQPFMTDLSQPSPFAQVPAPAPPMHPSHALPPQQAHAPQQSLVAQPIIGMPPYEPQPSGPELLPFHPQAQEWINAAQVGAPTGYDMSAVQTSAAMMEGYAATQQSFSYDTPMPATSHSGSGSDGMAQPTATISVLASDPSTPDDAPRGGGRPGTSRQSTQTSTQSETPPRQPSNHLASSMYRQSPSLHYAAETSTMDGLTERLGEFLFSPNTSAVSKKDEDAAQSQGKRRKQGLVASGNNNKQSRGHSPTSVNRMRAEYDGLMESSRSLLLDCFLAHVTLFFQMSVPRFRYRMTFADRRRPSLALLNAMYLWATRISNSPSMSNMEKHFFDQACKHLDVSMSTVDRLIDAVRAAMLLAAYSHSSGRHHEGWCIAGLAIRLVTSCGLHRIGSIVHRPEPQKNPFLRNRFFLLPPAEDAVELGERIHAFWAVFAIDRCGALATGYPAGLRDEEITTPFGRHLADVASGSVSESDNVTVRDLYRGIGAGGENDTPYTQWVKCVAILERSAKMIFLDPAEDSPYQQAWNQYSLTVHRDPGQPKPPEYLNQPKFRNPSDYYECLLAIDQLVAGIGDEGVFPVLRKMNAEQDGVPEPVIPTNIIMLHHMITAVHMVLHDINSIDVENQKALDAARKSVLLFRALPPIPFTDVDAFVVLVWSMIAKVLIKEVHRLALHGDIVSARAVSAEADTIVDEMARIGQTMHLARTQAAAVQELQQAALAAGDDANRGSDGTMFLPQMPQLESFMFPQNM